MVVSRRGRVPENITLYRARVRSIADRWPTRVYIALLTDSCIIIYTYLYNTRVYMPTRTVEITVICKDRENCMCVCACAF